MAADVERAKDFLRHAVDAELGQRRVQLTEGFLVALLRPCGQGHHRRHIRRLKVVRSRDVDEHGTELAFFPSLAETAFQLLEACTGFL